ncbi:MAG: hypothetical protein GF401_15865 [Chitinivibrionales bacterium]|nr:hypothetical protein [Chitinivibrionales bacterium]
MKKEIASYNWLNEAEMARLELQIHGIEAEVVESGITAANPLLGSAVGGVKIRVEQSQAQEAADLLKEYDKRIYENHKPSCPHCESENISETELSSLLKILSILTIGILTLAIARSYRCNECGHTWR